MRLWDGRPNLVTTTRSRVKTVEMMSRSMARRAFSTHVVKLQGAESVTTPLALAS